MSVYAIINGDSFNGMLTNDIVSFEQLGPVVLYIDYKESIERKKKIYLVWSRCQSAQSDIAAFTNSDNIQIRMRLWSEQEQLYYFVRVV